MTRHPLHRRLAVVVAALVSVSTLGACSEKDTDEERLLRSLDATADLSARFVYSENVAGQNVVVRGIIEDDFRYKARLTLNDTDVLDEVVNDDSLAVRFLEPSAVPSFVQQTAGAPVAALAERRWVIDRTGAPPVGLPVTDPKFAGIDPVVDSLAVLSYARQAITEGDGIRKYNSESLDYRPAEDPFPTPSADSGIERWDVVAPAFPKPDALANTSNTDAAFATVSQFRKLSVYVKDDRIIQVRERIAAEGKVLEKFGEFLESFADRGGPQLEKQVAEILDRFEGTQRAQLLLQVYNNVLEAGGRATVRFRTLDYELRDLGAKVAVALPLDVVEAKLDFFGVNAVRKAEDEAASKPAGATSTGNRTGTASDAGGSTSSSSPSADTTTSTASP